VLARSGVNRLARFAQIEDDVLVGDGLRCCADIQTEAEGQEPRGPADPAGSRNGAPSEVARALPAVEEFADLVEIL